MGQGDDVLDLRKIIVMFGLVKLEICQTSWQKCHVVQYTNLELRRKVLVMKNKLKKQVTQMYLNIDVFKAVDLNETI